MKMRSIKTLILLALLCALLNLTGCKPKKKTVPDQNKPDVPPVKTDANALKTDVTPVTPKTDDRNPADAVLVTVNGFQITQSQLDTLIKPHLERLIAQASKLPPAFLEQQKKLLVEQALQEMIKMQLLNEKVEEAGITITEKDVTDEIMKVASQQNPPATLEEFQKKMEDYGYDFEVLKSQIKTMLGHQKLIAQKYPDEAKVTDEDLKAFYEKNKARFETPEQVRASHILIKTELTDPNSDPNEVKAAAKAKAEDLLKQLNEGADFATLAKTHSDCPSAPRGGDLGLFPKGQMVPAFEKAAFELEVGKISDIVETKFGYHIIKVTEHKEADSTSFEEAKAGLMNEVTQTKARTLAERLIETLKKDAKIVYAPGMEPKPAAAPALPGAAVPGGQ
ncbi:MAG: peptidylprolyl isomerase [Sedimentisphaerales bacterium]|nr:peptidylprolyl isomerase [Sedimentisphaerales bacterium]